MELVEAPVEALVFRYFAALAGSLWTWWLALLAAALGLWRIRSGGADPVVPTSPTTASLSSFEDASSPDPAEGAAPLYDVAAAERAVDFLRCRLEGSEDGGVGGTPKGRFTVYYHVELVDEEDEVDGECGIDVGDMGKAPALGYGWKWEEAMEARRTGDFGWYCYQDRTTLNGSVVRLWDRKRRWPAASPSRRAAAIVEV